jgi:uncharacterized heparinase superfamily protein
VIDFSVQPDTLTPEPQRSYTHVEKLGLLLRTVAHLQPAQVGQRIRLRSQRVVDPWWTNRPLATTASGSSAQVGWPTGFRALDSKVAQGDPDAVSDGRFRFLNQERSLGEQADWIQADAPRLWRFHLHYFEWAWTLATHTDRDRAGTAFLWLWRSWSRHVNSHNRDAWSPYVVSLRAWVLCDVFASLIEGTPVEHEFIRELHRHARFVQSHLELDVGGNHLIKNLKALTALGVFLGDLTLVDAARRLLSEQLPVQILADGGHYERSPSYHCQVLGDLIDVRGLLEAAHQDSISGLDDAIDHMQRWLASIVTPDGKIPLLNDAIPESPERIALLIPGGPCSDQLTLLASSGYVVIRPSTRVHVVLDVGDPCPEELPAHAHADCLSFVLWVDLEQWIVDTGTSTYEAGTRRNFERSTAAHNTVEIDGQDQTEVWGTFRAARRARGSVEHLRACGATVEVLASHDGYRRLAGSPVHQRHWRVTPSQLDITDTIRTTGTHHVVSRLHVVAPDTAHGSITGQGGQVSGRTGDIACGFGHIRPATVCQLEADAATELKWTIRWF